MSHRYSVTRVKIGHGRQQSVTSEDQNRLCVREVEDQAEMHDYLDLFGMILLEKAHGYPQRLALTLSTMLKILTVDGKQIYLSLNETSSTCVKPA